MGLRDWLSEQSTAVTVLILIVVVPIVLLVLAVVVIGVLFVLFAILGTFVLGLGGEQVDTSVQAGASVQFDEEASEVSVTFTSNQNAEYLLVEVEVEGGAVEVVSTSGSVTSQGEAIRLDSVGSKVVLGKVDPDSNPTVTITVSAVGPEGSRSVIVTKDGQL